MDGKKQEFSPLPPEFSAAAEFTPLPGEFGQTVGASPAVKPGRRWWKKALYALAGLAVLAAAAFSGGAAPDTPVTPGTPDTPPVQEETYPLTGTLYCTAYNDTFGPDGQPLLLWDGMAVEMSALTDAPLSLPQPQQPELAGAVFLGWVGRYDTAGGKVYRLMSDPLTAAEAAAIRPDEGGDRHLVLRAAWRGDGTSSRPWQLTLDDGEAAVEYDASPCTPAVWCTSAPIRCRSGRDRGSRAGAMRTASRWRRCRPRRSSGSRTAKRTGRRPGR